MMGWEYIQSDRDLVGTGAFRLQLHRANMGGPIEGCGSLTDKSKRQVDPNSTVDIEFQFPPKVLTDGRRGNWNEQDLGGGQEPVATFKTSGPRTLSLAWTYIVDSATSSGWNIKRITKNVRTLRGYFANIRDYDSNRDGLVVMLRMWCIGGLQEMTARIVTIDVKYGEALVYGGDVTQAFPLRTDITVDLRLWTKGFRTRVESPGSAFGPGEVIDLEKELGQQDLKSLVTLEPPEWY